MVKLTNKKIRWLVLNVSKKKVSTDDAAFIYKVSRRRVQQLVNEYQDTGKVPELKKNRRPRTFLTQEQKDAIENAWKETRLGARLLYYELNRRKWKIPKNKMHKHLVATGKSVPDPRKQKKRKRCRYEREHSGSLIHGDWYENLVLKKQVIAWEDDASRLILAGGEFGRATAGNSIKTLKKAVARAGEWSVLIREANTDRGSQFINNRGGMARFVKKLGEFGIRHVPSRVRNPQTNGKLERLFQEYQKHRGRFSSFDEFAEWYNNRLHGALDLERAERPMEAWQRKLPPESMIGLFNRIRG